MLLNIKYIYTKHKSKYSYDSSTKVPECDTLLIRRHIIYNFLHIFECINLFYITKFIRVKLLLF